MIPALVWASIFIIPVAVLVAGFTMAGRPVSFRPLLFAGLSFLIYVLLLKSPTFFSAIFPDVGSLPLFPEQMPSIWPGKCLSIAGTIALIWALPGISFRAVGVTLTQNHGTVVPALITGAITLIFAVGTALLLSRVSDTSFGNLLFQATLPGLDEELFLRGLMLLLLHQAFGKGLRIFGAETGWGFWLVVIIFGLLHGFQTSDAGININVWAIVSTGYVGFILTWMRERTGSLLIPILFHNVFNVAMTIA